MGGSPAGRVEAYYGRYFAASRLDQRRLGGQGSIPIGGIVPEAGFGISAVVKDPNGGTLWLEVEVRKVGEPFTGAVTHVSGDTPMEQTASVAIGTLDRGSGYHWQARVRNVVSDAVFAWVSFGSDPEDENETDVSIRLNAPPAEPSPAQVDPKEDRQIAVGSHPAGVEVRFQSTVSDPDGVDRVSLEVEARPIGESFSSVATSAGPLTSSGGTASVDVALPLGRFHWQCRAVDEYGEASPWVRFGGNPETSTDVAIYGGSSNAASCLGSAFAPFSGLWLSALATLFAIRRPR
jgi:hypothetical protein